jgi:predicted RNA-binding Zn ribbon-like protein
MARSIRDPKRFVHLAVDLVNTARDGHDFMVTPYDLHAFLLESGEPEPFDVNGTDVAEVLELRGRLRRVFMASSEDKAAKVLNEVLHESATAPYLSRHDEVGWHLHVAKPDAEWAEWLSALTATGLAELVSGGGFDRMRVCAADACDRAFIDESRNHSQRFCCQSCATRTRVNAYRARQVPDGEEAF